MYKLLLTIFFYLPFIINPQEISFDENNPNLEVIISEIESQTDLKFAYGEDVNPTTKLVGRFSFEKENLDEVLKKLSRRTPYALRIIGNNIAISVDPQVEKSESIKSTQILVEGKVTDAIGLPLPSVTVQEQGTNNGVLTDFDGNFTIEVQSQESVLVFTYIGMQTARISVGGQTTMEVQMEADEQALEEVVVVGYGAQKKVNVTGAVSSISGQKLAENPAPNVAATLQGRLPGVTITQTSGQPGNQNANILIRGMGTMNNSSPMVVIDGIESSLENISPHDIESISVLKDASAAAIYGSRAANGVILVTTKRGTTGPPVISYHTYFGFQKPTDLPQHVSSAQYASLINEGKVNEGLAPIYSDEEIEMYSSGVDPFNFPNTDWVNLLLKDSALTQDHYLGFSGGNEVARYRISLEYLDQDGLVSKTNHQRYNLRVNLDSKVNEWLTIGLNSNLSRNDISSPVSPYMGGGISTFFRQANRIPPTISNKLEDGSWGRHIDGNPIAWIEEGGLANIKTSRLVGSTFGEIGILKGLTLKGIAGVDYSLNDNKTHVKTITYGDGSVQGPNSVTDSQSRNTTIDLQSLLNYDTTIDKHGIKVLLGASYWSNEINVNEGYRKNLPTNELDQLTLGSTIGWTNDGYTNESILSSYFGRINYSFDRRYLFEANLRRDGSSKFASNKRWGMFPSFSAGWRVSEENFMENVEWLYNLKLRGSWGKLGNHRISDYQYLAKIALGQNYNFGGTVADGAAMMEAANPNITWETTTEFDIGLEVDFFSNRLLSLTVDYYNRFTDDILIDVPVSAVFGLPAPVRNAGAMRNRGLEIQLQHQNNVGDFHYNFSFNGAYNKNRVEDYENPTKGDRIRMEGLSWDSFYGYEWIGYFQTDQEAASSPHQTGASVKAGDLRFRDKNNDGIINGDDRVVLGNVIPEITYGLNSSLQYKNFDLSIFFQGADKVNRSLGNESLWPFIIGSNALGMHLDRTIVNDGQIVQSGYFPRTLIDQTHNQVMSSFSVRDASYLRLKNFQVGYNLPTRIISAITMARARVYFSGQNLVTFSDFPSGFDPELADGSGYYAYPQIKTYTFGLDINF